MKTNRFFILTAIICIASLFSVDLAYGYPPISPYAYCNNNPIRYVDPDGRTIRVYDYVKDQKVSYDWRQHEGNWGFYDSGNTAYAGSNNFIGQLSGALSGLMSGGSAGHDLVNNLAGIDDIITIGQGRNVYVLESQTVGWNPNGGSNIPTQNGADANVPFVSLGHELAHAWDYTQGTANTGTWINGEAYGTKSIPNSEIFSTHKENQIRTENGLQLRTHYLITPNGIGAGPRIIDAQRRSIYYNTNNTTIYKGVPIKNRFRY